MNKKPLPSAPKQAPARPAPAKTFANLGKKK